MFCKVNMCSLISNLTFCKYLLMGIYCVGLNVTFAIASIVLSRITDFIVTLKMVYNRWHAYSYRVNTYCDVNFKG